MRMTFKTPGGAYEIDDDLRRVDFATVHAWLSSAPWSRGIERWKVEKAALHSEIVVGVYDSDVQIGYGRVVSDTVRFAYVADVFVAEAYRKRGVALSMMRFLQKHPALEDAPHLTLKTLNAHGLYARAGFAPVADPQNWMRWVRAGAAPATQG